LKNAYAYKKLLKKAGVIALGTDFPVEEVNPMLTFHAAARIAKGILVLVFRWKMH
jgi:predicted amidohydrolase YtcJ